MRQSGAFHRALAMVAAVASLMQRAAGNFAMQQSGLKELGPYKSRGKGGAVPHRHVGTKAYQRAAKKARNVRRNRSH